MQMSAPNSKGSLGPGQLCPRGAQCHQHCIPAAQSTCRTLGGVLAGGTGQQSVLLPCSCGFWQEVGTAISSEKLHLDPRGWRELFALPRGRLNFISKVDAMFLVFTFQLVHTNSSELQVTHEGHNSGLKKELH